MMGYKESHLMEDDRSVRMKHISQKSINSPFMPVRHNLYSIDVKGSSNDQIIKKNPCGSSMKSDLTEDPSDKIENESDESYLKCLSQLTEDIAQNFFLFHSTIFNKIQQDKDTEIILGMDKMVVKYSMRFRDIILLTLNQLSSRKSLCTIPERESDLREAIKLYDILHRVLIEDHVHLSCNMMQWWILWFSEHDLPTNDLKNELSKCIELFTDFDYHHRVRIIDSFLCRLLCRCEFDAWINFIQKITKYNEEIQPFLDSVNLGFVELKCGLSGKCISISSYSSGLRILRQSIRIFGSSIGKYLFLKKSVKLLSGDISVTKICSNDFKEQFIARIYWTNFNRCLADDVVDHWRIFIKENLEHLKDSKITFLDQVCITLWSSEKKTQIIDLLQKGKDQFSYPLFVHPHIIDSMYLKKLLMDLPDDGEVYRAKSLFNYGLNLFDAGEEDIAWMYLGESARCIAVGENFAEFLTQGLRKSSTTYDEFLSYETKLINVVTLDGSHVDISLILNFLKDTTKRLLKLGKFGMIDNIKFALHHDKYALRQNQMSQERNREQCLVDELLFEYLATDVENMQNLLCVFSLYFKKFDNIIKLNNSDAKLYQIMRKYGLSLQIIESFKDKMLIGHTSLDKLNWIRKNYKLLRGTIHFLFRILNLKVLPLAALPPLIRHILLFLFGCNYEFSSYLVSSEDFDEFYTGYRDLLSSFTLSDILDENIERICSMSDEINTIINKSKYKLSSQNSPHFENMEDTLDDFYNL